MEALNVVSIFCFPISLTRAGGIALLTGSRTQKLVLE